MSWVAWKVDGELMRLRGRHIRRSGTALAAALVAVAVLVPVASATDPDGPAADTPVSPDPPTTSVTVPAPSTTSPVPAASSTTTPRPTTTPPGTTLPPVDDATVNSDASGFSTAPAPLIPSADDDPLFHAALTVDDDLVVLAKAKVAYLTQIAATRRVAAHAGAIRRVNERDQAADSGALDRLRDSRAILRAAALHAYAGFGSAEAAAAAPEVDGGDPLSYRTYVRVTMADASRHVSDAERTRAGTRSVAEATARRNRDAQSALSASRAAERRAKDAVVEAEKTLARDRGVLAMQIAATPDMAPGLLDRLPDDVQLTDGAVAVDSPVGTIVVPGTADPRTATALTYIVAQIGKPYVWGATGPNSYDCSGLMLRGFQAAGVRSMPRVSQGQQAWATPIDPKDIQPGDLVFFGDPAYHVGVYIGGGLMIDAPYTGARVRVDRVWSSVTGYGRVVW